MSCSSPAPTGASAGSSPGSLHGRLDVLVNNAAVHYDTWQRATTADLEVLREALEVNLLGAWVATDMGGPGGRPVAEGAARVLWAVDLPDDGPTGGFYRDGRPVLW